MCKTIVFRVLFSYTMNEIPGRIRLSVKLIRCMHLLQKAKKKNVNIMKMNTMHRGKKSKLSRAHLNYCR